ncbi:MAG: prepilin-type N-terminal cleavage/methylation domain-containing protein [Candidatus Omnitrophica bacterium]|nr:prepilin-type N-terminal cleavage/methylation domain-containing protein [Candidatus Omnitrophota bacterium]
MILLIGRSKGFTLVEVMLSVCILSLVGTLIYQAVLVLTDAYQRYRLTLESLPWLNEKIYQIKETLRNFGPTIAQSHGEVFLGDKEYLWNLNLNFIKEPKDYRLYEIQLSLSTLKGKTFGQTREAYVLYEKK